MMTMEDRVTAAAQAAYGEHFQRYRKMMRRALQAAFPELFLNPPGSVVVRRDEPVRTEDETS